MKKHGNFDHQQIDRLRANAEGRRFGADQHTAENWDWIKPGEPSERACLDILRGKLGRYPLFGILMEVSMRRAGEEEFAALVYWGAEERDAGQNLCGALREGFWIGVRELLKDPSRGFKNEDHELFILTLLMQQEMQFALPQFREEEAAAREEERRLAEEARRNMEERKKKVLAGLREQFGGVQTSNEQPTSAPSTPAKREKTRPVLQEFKELLTAESGMITREGVEVYVSKGPQGKCVIRIKSVEPEHDHQLEFSEIAKRNFFVDQNSLLYSGDRPSAKPESYEGPERMRYIFRTWLRKQLIKDGVTLHEPVDFESPTGKGTNAQMAEKTGEGNTSGAGKGSLHS